MYKRASLAAVAIFFVSLRRFGVVSSICTKSASLATVVFLCVCRFVAMHKGPALNCFDFVVCVLPGAPVIGGDFFFIPLVAVNMFLWLFMLKSADLRPVTNYVVSQPYL